MKFTKMHGCGNDYIYVDAWEEELPADPGILAPTLCPRHTGIGGDGIITIGPAEDPEAHARMRMWNADGSESEMCGNGLRCATRLAHDHGHLPGTRAVFETGAGLKHVELIAGPTGALDQVRVDMGRPLLLPEEIPVAAEADPELIRCTLHLEDGQHLAVAAVGMGNPHAIHLCEGREDGRAFDLEQIGPMVECHPTFPNRTNFHVVERCGTDGGTPCLRQRTWERGAGITQACGTGACASVVAAIRAGFIHKREARVHLDGGDLLIAWLDDDGPVSMTGEAITVFTGDIAI